MDEKQKITYKIIKLITKKIMQNIKRLANGMEKTRAHAAKKD